MLGYELCSSRLRHLEKGEAGAEINQIMNLLRCIEAFYSAPPATEPAHACDAGAVPELDFPIDLNSGPSPTRIEPEALLLRSEAHFRFRNGSPESAQRRLERKCDVEFVME